SICLWNLETDKLHCTFGGDFGLVRSLAFSPDSKTLALGSERETIRLWDVASGKDLFPEEHRGPVSRVAFSPDGKLLASAGREPAVALWDVALGTRVRLCQEYSGEILDMVFEPDGKTLVCGHWDRRVGPAGYTYTIRSCDVDTGKELRRFPVSGLHGTPRIAF